MQINFVYDCCFQEQVKDLEMRLARAAGDTGSFIEKNRLKDILEDKNHQIDKLRRDEEILRDQLSYARREVGWIIIINLWYSEDHFL